MPQLDTLSYFPQFIFLLISFLSIYYLVVTFILPNTISAGKLRAKFNSQSEKNSDSFGLAETSNQSTQLKEKVFTLTLEALMTLARKSASLSTLEELNIANKNDKYTIQPPLMHHYTTVLTNKKRYAVEDLTQV